VKPEFWQERWRKREIGFHMSKPHAALREYWPALDLAAGSRVFVPLAGKSLDMLWLAERGHEVVGIELSTIAVEEFHAEHPQLARVDLRCGDFFALTPAALGPISAVFDRAALVALPPAMRADYARQLTALCPPGTRTLLIAMEYEQDRLSGPPHAVMPEEVHALFGAHHRISELGTDDALEDFPRFAARGVPWLRERFYLLERGTDMPSA